MGRTKMAPALRALVEERADLRAEAAELRALLAVARAAQRLVDVEGRDGPEAVAAVRALSRLARASEVDRG